MKSHLYRVCIGRVEKGLECLQRPQAAARPSYIILQRDRAQYYPDIMTVLMEVMNLGMDHNRLGDAYLPEYKVLFPR